MSHSPSRAPRRWSISLSSAAVIIAGLSTCKGASSGPPTWDKDIVRMWSAIPVQEGGRIKPLATVARFTLLQLHGAQTIKVERDGKTVRRSAIEWFLDALLRPDTVVDDPLFRVQNSDVLDAIEMTHEGKRKRDYYSHVELRPGFARLFDLGGRYQDIPDKDRSLVQK